MQTMPYIEAVLTVPHIRVQNANAISSPLTWGFPSITAFLGLCHRLHREFECSHDIQFQSVGVVCHSYEAQVNEDYTQTFNLTRNPLNEKGETSGIVEEGRIHLDISLVFGLTGSGLYNDQTSFLNAVGQILPTLRVAGGSIINSQTKGKTLSMLQPYLELLPEDDEQKITNFYIWKRKFIPGFVLISREDILQQAYSVLQKEDKTLFDAWLHVSRMNFRSAQSLVHTADNENNEKVIWRNERLEQQGWFVPMSVGYRGLTELYEPGEVRNARDEEYPFRFVENIYSIGQWVSPLNLNNYDDFFWFFGHSQEAENGLYRCYNNGKV